jgi:hypothetical protein
MEHSARGSGLRCVDALCGALDAEDNEGAARITHLLCDFMTGKTPSDALPGALCSAETLSKLLILAGGADLQREFDVHCTPPPPLAASAPTNALLLLSRLVDCAPAVGAALVGAERQRVLSGAAPHLLAALSCARAGERCARAFLLLAALLAHDGCGGELAARHGDMYFPLLCDAVAALRTSSAGDCASLALERLVSALHERQLAVHLIAHFPSVRRMLAAAVEEQPAAGTRLANLLAALLRHRGGGDAAVALVRALLEEHDAAGRALLLQVSRGRSATMPGPADLGAAEIKHLRLRRAAAARACDCSTREDTRDAAHRAAGHLLAGVRAAHAARAPNRRHALARANIMMRREVLFVSRDETCLLVLLQAASACYDVGIILADDSGGSEPAFAQTRGLTLTWALPELLLLADVASDGGAAASGDGVDARSCVSLAQWLLISCMQRFLDAHAPFHGNAAGIREACFPEPDINVIAHVFSLAGIAPLPPAIAAAAARVVWRFQAPQQPGMGVACLLMLAHNGDDSDAARCARRGCGATLSNDGRKLKVCGRCRRAAYCSQTCHEQDWQRHKAECVHST